MIKKDLKELDTKLALIKRMVVSLVDLGIDHKIAFTTIIIILYLDESESERDISS